MPLKNLVLNTLQPVAAATRPRGMVLVNGERAAGLVSFEVDNNSYFQADTFRVTLALSAQPANRGFAFWAAQTSMKVELLAGYPANPDNFTKSDLKSWLTGWVDDIEVSPLQDEITITGRDMTALLIDKKPSHDYSVSGYQDVKTGYTEMFSSEIAAHIAQDAGLQSNVVRTPAIVGPMIGNVRKVLNDRGTLWDILTKLAQIEGYSVFVEGHTLHFIPRPDAESIAQYVLNYEPPCGRHAYTLANFTSIRLSRNLSVARGVKVTVQSFNQKTGKAVSATATRSHVKNTTTQGVGSTSLPPAEYFRVVPNLDHLQCQRLANSILAEISHFEMNLEADIPADNVLTSLTPVRLLGSGTDFDQTYYPASIQRRYSLEDGYRMSLRARNVSPEMGFV